MNTRLTIENTGPGALLCTLDVPMGDVESIRITLKLPKDPNRTVSQLEYQLVQKAKDRFAEMCNAHQESKRA